MVLLMRRTTRSESVYYTGATTLSRDYNTKPIMDEQYKINPEEKRKSELWRFFGGLVAIVVLVFAGLWGMGQYERYLRTQNVQKLADTLAENEKATYAQMMADTYGGKTPQETLSMYIAAVEKGDYELASKYFVLDKQADELSSWKGTKPEDVTNAVLLFKQVLKTEGSYSDDGKGFAIRKPVLFDFTLYPNGIWKIIEI